MAEGGSGKGVALAALAAGALLLYSGLFGKNVLGLTKGLIAGQKPSTAPAANTITDQTATASSGTPGSVPSSASGSAISADAVQYAGAGYVWGGAPAKGVGNWDCSSFVNWVCGHDLGLPIPTYAAGTYTGTSHGPTTQVWLLWSGLTGVSSNPADAQPGDLCVWETHMGIALGGGQMISALDTADGTKITTIQDGAPGGELLYIRRYVFTSTAPARPAGVGPVS